MARPVQYVRPFRAFKRTRQITRHVRDPAADESDPAAFIEEHETIHEVLDPRDEGSRFLRGHWQRVAQP